MGRVFIGSKVVGSKDSSGKFTPKEDVELTPSEQRIISKVTGETITKTTRDSQGRVSQTVEATPKAKEVLGAVAPREAQGVQVRKEDAPRGAGPVQAKQEARKSKGKPQIYATPEAGRVLKDIKHEDVDKTIVTHGRFGSRQTLTPGQYESYKSFSSRGETQGFYTTARMPEPISQTIVTRQPPRLTKESEQIFRSQQAAIWESKRSEAKRVSTPEREITSFESAVMSQQIREQESQERLGRIQKFSRLVTFGGEKTYEERGFIGKRSELVVAASIGLPFYLGEGVASATEKAYLTGRGLVASPEKTKEEYKRTKESEEYKRVFDPTTPEGLTTYIFAGAGAYIYTVGKTGVYRPGAKPGVKPEVKPGAKPGVKVPKGQKPLGKFFDTKGELTRKATRTEAKIPSVWREKMVTKWDAETSARIKKLGYAKTESGELVYTGKQKAVRSKPSDVLTRKQWEAKGYRATESGELVKVETPKATISEQFARPIKGKKASYGQRVILEEPKVKSLLESEIKRGGRRIRPKGKSKIVGGRIMGGLIGVGGGLSGPMATKEFGEDPLKTNGLQKIPQKADYKKGRELIAVPSTRELLAQKSRVSLETAAGLAMALTLRQVLGVQQPGPGPQESESKKGGYWKGTDIDIGGGLRGIYRRPTKPKRARGIYTPSQSAKEFNIIGKMPKGTLTGLEQRPLPNKKKTKKKRERDLFEPLIKI